MDPDLIILDGSEEVTSLSWKGMKDRDEHYYVLSLDDEDQQDLLNYLDGLGNGNLLVYAVGDITAAAAGALAAVLLRKKK